MIGKERAPFRIKIDRTLNLLTIHYHLRIVGVLKTGLGSCLTFLVFTWRWYESNKGIWFLSRFALFWVFDSYNDLVLYYTAYLIISHNNIWKVKPSTKLHDRLARMGIKNYAICMVSIMISTVKVYIYVLVLRKLTSNR